MVELLALITSLLSNGTAADVFQTYNPKSKQELTYPYVTFDIDNENLKDNCEGAYIDISIFDYSPSMAGIYQTESDIRDALAYKRGQTDDISYMIDYQTSTTIPTGDQLLKRRNMKFYVQFEWRMRQWN